MELAFYGGGGGWLIFHFSIIEVLFVFYLYLNVLFKFFIKYFHITLIIFEFRLG